MAKADPGHRARTRELIVALLVVLLAGSAAAQPPDPVPPLAAAPPQAPPPQVPSPPAASPPASPASAPLTGRERADWFVDSTVGPRSLCAGVVSAAWGVARDSPDEYGDDWAGFGKRYALRLSGVAIGNAIEAGVGAAWDEDPRYTRTSGRRPMSRLAHAARMTVFASRPGGRIAPAYARWMGIVGNNFITNAWRVDSDSSIADAWSRAGVGVAGRFVSNVFDEFWPDIQRKVFRRGARPSTARSYAPAAAPVPSSAAAPVAGTR